MSDDGRPLISGFGLSASISSASLQETTGDALGGSIRWMARELLTPSIFFTARHTKETDMWAFGVVICVSPAFNIYWRRNTGN